MKNIIYLLLLLTSCKSFLISGEERFDMMCVRDTTGCGFKNVNVMTKKLGVTSYKLSFLAITPRDTILIPEMVFDYTKPTYTGLGLNKVKYTVTYKFEGKETTISVHSVKGNLTLSTKNICSIYEF